MKDLPELQDSAFDLRTRAELALAFDPGQPPAHLFRNTPLLSRRGFQRGLAALFLTGGAAGTVLAIIPTLLLLIFGQRFIVRGLTGGSLK